MYSTETCTKSLITKLKTLLVTLSDRKPIRQNMTAILIALITIANVKPTLRVGSRLQKARNALSFWFRGYLFSSNTGPRAEMKWWPLT